jgi:hypothetical protein
MLFEAGDSWLPRESFWSSSRGGIVGHGDKQRRQSLTLSWVSPPWLLVLLFKNGELKPSTSSRVADGGQVRELVKVEDLFDAGELPNVESSQLIVSAGDALARVSISAVFAAQHSARRTTL